MSRLEILDKLEEGLLQPITKESQVVYIFCQIRKILEIAESKGSFEYLRFYCNWALHASLNQFKKTTIVHNMLLEYNKNTFKDEKFHQFYYFREDLLSFLNKYKLPTLIVDDPKEFNHLIQLLIEIYHDTPLFIPNDDKSYLKITVKRMKFTSDIFSFDININTIDRREYKKSN